MSAPRQVSLPPISKVLIPAQQFGQGFMTGLQNPVYGIVEGGNAALGPGVIEAQSRAFSQGFVRGAFSQFLPPTLTAKLASGANIGPDLIVIVLGVLLVVFGIYKLK